MSAAQKDQLDSFENHIVSLTGWTNNKMKSTTCGFRRFTLLGALLLLGAINSARAITPTVVVPNSDTMVEGNSNNIRQNTARTFDQNHAPAGKPKVESFVKILFLTKQKAAAQTRRHQKTIEINHGNQNYGQ